MGNKFKVVLALSVIGAIIGWMIGGWESALLGASCVAAGLLWELLDPKL